MKKTLLILSAVFLTASMFLPKQANAQAPQKMSYQAVIRNSGGQLVSNTEVRIRVGILNGIEGELLWQEEQLATTNINGLLTIEIGSEVPLFTDMFSNSSTLYLKTEIDPSGGSNYTITGVSQLLSVPYALHAKAAETLTSGINENDPVFGASVATGITGTDTLNWNNAYNWGNHAESGYLKSFTEMDTTNWKINSSDIYYTNGNVGIGTASPTNTLSVLGTANFSSLIQTPSILPLAGEGTNLSIQTNSVTSNAINVGSILIKTGNNNGPKNSPGRVGDITIAGGDLNIPFPTGSTESYAGNIYIRGGASPNGGGGVAFPGIIYLNGGEGGTNARGGAINLQAGSGNTGGNINIRAGAGVGPGHVNITAGTSTTLALAGNVVLSGGDKSGGGIYGSIIFNTAQTQRAIIDITGNVGIGTGTPTSKLDVNGIITATGGNSENWNNKLDSETDPEFMAWDKDFEDLINKPDLTVFATKNMNNANITNLADPVGAQDAATKAYVDNSAPIKYEVGDFAHGGIVFWVDETGQHGLVCFKDDLGIPVRWHAGTDGNTRAHGDGLLAGKANTCIIIAAQVAIGDDGASYAASICNELHTLEGYGDWYLPSRDELNLMFINMTAINNTAIANEGSAFDNTNYWSSTEGSNEMAWRQKFSDGTQSLASKSNMHMVRAVRTF